MELVKNFKYIKIIKYFFVILFSTVILAISSKIKIPFYPVPMTMQTFVVLLIGVCFGWRLGASIIAFYLFEGIFGLPVFSGTPEKGTGIVYFVGPTMGYLIGFIFAAVMSGLFNYSDNIVKNFSKLVLSVSVIYLFGLLWLGGLIGWDKPILELGLKPFWLAELFKVALLAFLITLMNEKIMSLKKLI